MLDHDPTPGLPNKTEEGQAEGARCVRAHGLGLSKPQHLLMAGLGMTY